MIEKLINEYLAEQQSKPRVGSGKFNVSDAGRCHLMRFWKRQATIVPTAFDDRTLRVFEVGHIFHKWVQNILATRGVLLGAESKVEDEHRVGIIDMIIQLNGKIILYDFKTVHSGKFSYIKKEADIHYHYQAATYTDIYGVDNKSVLIDETRICYISKDDLRIQEVPVLVTKQQLDDDWLPLIESWEKKEEPKPNPLKWECGGKKKKSYCQYSTICSGI